MLATAAMIELEPVLAAYRHATGRWTGCHWDQSFIEEGCEVRARNLTGDEDPAELAATLRPSSDSMFHRYLRAAERAIRFAKQCRIDALLAEDHALMAVELATDGQIHRALEEAHRAVELERKYREPEVWGALEAAIAAASHRKAV